MPPTRVMDRRTKLWNESLVVRLPADASLISHRAVPTVPRAVRNRPGGADRQANRRLESDASADTKHARRNDAGDVVVAGDGEMLLETPGSSRR